MRIALSVDRSRRVRPFERASSLIVIDVASSGVVTTAVECVPDLSPRSRIDLVEACEVDLVLCRSIDAAEAARLTELGVGVWAGQYALVTARSERERAERSAAGDSSRPLLLAAG